jgi:hypothetical protein
LVRRCAVPHRSRARAAPQGQRHPPPRLVVPGRRFSVVSTLPPNVGCSKGCSHLRDRGGGRYARAPALDNMTVDPRIGELEQENAALDAGSRSSSPKRRSPNRRSSGDSSVNGWCLRTSPTWSASPTNRIASFI